MRTEYISSTSEAGLGPGTLAAVLQCLHLDTTLPEQQNMNYMGLKLTARMSSQDKFWTKGTKKPKYHLSLQNSLQQKQGTAHAPCT